MTVQRPPTSSSSPSPSPSPSPFSSSSSSSSSDVHVQSHPLSPVEHPSSSSSSSSSSYAPVTYLAITLPVPIPDDARLSSFLLNCLHVFNLLPPSSCTTPPTSSPSSPLLHGHEEEEEEDDDDDGDDDNNNTVVELLPYNNNNNNINLNQFRLAFQPQPHHSMSLPINNDLALRLTFAAVSGHLLLIHSHSPTCSPSMNHFPLAHRMSVALSLAAVQDVVERTAFTCFSAHVGIACSHCHVKPIIGTRYRRCSYVSTNANNNNNVKKSNGLVTEDIQNGNENGIANGNRKSQVINLCEQCRRLVDARPKVHRGKEKGMRVGMEKEKQKIKRKSNQSTVLTPLTSSGSCRQLFTNGMKNQQSSVNHIDNDNGIGNGNGFVFINSARDDGKGGSLNSHRAYDAYYDVDVDVDVDVENCGDVSNNFTTKCKRSGGVNGGDDEHAQVIEYANDNDNDNDNDDNDGDDDDDNDDYEDGDYEDGNAVQDDNNEDYDYGDDDDDDATFVVYDHPWEASDEYVSLFSNSNSNSNVSSTSTSTSASSSFTTHPPPSPPPPPPPHHRPTPNSRPPFPHAQHPPRRQHPHSNCTSNFHSTATTSTHAHVPAPTDATEGILRAPPPPLQLGDVGPRVLHLHYVLYKVGVLSPARPWFRPGVYCAGTSEAVGKLHTESSYSSPATSCGGSIGNGSGNGGHNDNISSSMLVHNHNQYNHNCIKLHNLNIHQQHTGNNNHNSNATSAATTTVCTYTYTAVTRSILLALLDEHERRQIEAQVRCSSVTGPEGAEGVHMRMALAA